MRVLVTSWVWASHSMPLVPLAWALRAAGHEVHVASQPRLTGVIWGTSTSSIGDGDTFVPARLVQALTELEVDVGLALDEQDVRRLGGVPQLPTPADTVARLEQVAAAQ